MNSSSLIAHSNSTLTPERTFAISSRTTQKRRLSYSMPSRFMESVFLDSRRSSSMNCIKAGTDGRLPRTTSDYSPATSFKHSMFVCLRVVEKSTLKVNTRGASGQEKKPRTLPSSARTQRSKRKSRKIRNASWLRYSNLVKKDKQSSSKRHWPSWRPVATLRSLLSREKI